MSIFSELNYNSNIRDVKGIQFGILSPEEIKKRSVVHVTQPILYDANSDPVVGGLFDPRMGVLDRGKICPTDEYTNMFCPGYFGHIELAKPVIFTHLMKEVVKCCKVCCIRCSRLLIDYSDDTIKVLNDTPRSHRLNKLNEYVKRTKYCNNSGCNAPKPKSVKKDGYATIIITWPEPDNMPDDYDKSILKEELTPEKLLKIFKRIKEDDYKLMGFSSEWCKPEWLICTVLPVAPPAVRPSVKQYNNNRSEDDITHKFIDIIKTNNTLRDKINKGTSVEQVINDWHRVLQYHVSTLIDNDIPGINPAAHRSGRTLKTLKQRLKGKDSRIRGNLMGKRVNFSARSVITGDPNISIDELGVPIKIAKNLTYPEIVTRYNIEEMYKLVRNGPEIYPGSKSIKSKSDGKTRRLHNLDRTKIILNYGDIINRHIKDGDTVLFNRQPSLHKMSMMAHRIKVMKGNTFRLNLSACKPYNADFDGDEMNMHVPQSLQTLVELMDIANVKNQIISPTVSKPIIYPVQDSLLGINRLTKDGVYFSKRELMNILMKIKHFNGEYPEPELKNPDRWSGRQLLSIILPEVNIKMGNKSYEPQNENAEENFVVIENGIHKNGPIDKDILTKASRGLVHMIFNDYGPERTKIFLDNVQDIVTEFLLNTGFSVGISDLVADKTVNDKMREVIHTKKKEVLETVKHVHLNIFENISGGTNEDAFESKVKNMLEQANPKAGKIGRKSLDNANRVVNMVTAGSKGSDINIAQMISCLGQQSVDGKRIPKGYSDRTLPHYNKYDDTPESRGFVESSFIQGLNPQEFFFHAMGGREGLIDTAVKTSDTGYIQRKLIKAMEDLKVYHDLSVRNETGTIVQFIYGDDGADSTKMEKLSLTQKIGKYSINYKEITHKKLVNLFKFTKTERWGNYLFKDTIKDMKSDTNWNDVLENHFKQIENDRIVFNHILKDYQESTLVFTIDFKRLIETTKYRFMIDDNMKTNLNPVYVIEQINDLTKDMVIGMGSRNLITDILIRYFLSPKLLCKYRRFTQEAFDYIVNMIKLKLIDATVQTGEMVGPIAAQSIGEPSTQMTLNTFHFAGLAAKSNVTRGVPRLKEILHISKSAKGDSLTIFLNDDYKFDKTKSIDILSNLELTLMKDLIKSTRIYYDPDDYNTNVKEDIEFLKIYQEFSALESCDITYSPWLLRFELDKSVMMDKNITMDDIHLKLNIIQPNISCLYTDDNYHKLICRIKIQSKKSQSAENDINLLKSLEQTLLNTILKGISGITKVTMRKNNNNVEYSNGNYINKPEWVLDTNGSNMIEIFSHKGIDFKRTFTNNVIEAYDVLGIEAARNTLIRELYDVIEASGQYVNNRHLALLSDNMTSKGYLMSVDRFGINRSNRGTLAKCSFEETPEILYQAALFGDYDNLNGVSANIMVGQVPKCGTGDSDIILDEVKLFNQMQDIETQEEDTEEIITQHPDCHIENFDFEFNIDDIGHETIDINTIPDIKLTV